MNYDGTNPEVFLLVGVGVLGGLMMLLFIVDLIRMHVFGKEPWARCDNIDY